jgi:polysaccharide export outer membrane protein
MNAGDVANNVPVMRLTFALALVAVLTACGAPPASPNPGFVPHDEDHTLGPNDVFDVRVYGQKELSQPYRVDVDGTIRFPMIGVVHVAGRTAADVEEEIQRRLADGYVRKPNVSIFVKEQNSKWISVLGEVRSPGTLPFSTNMTIVDAISQAGGFSPTAQKDGTTVTRAAEGGKRYVVAVEKIARAEAEAFYLRPGDTIFVPKRTFP